MPWSRARRGRSVVAFNGKTRRAPCFVSSHRQRRAGRSSRSCPVRHRSRDERHRLVLRGHPSSARGRLIVSVRERESAPSPRKDAPVSQEVGAPLPGWFPHYSMVPLPLSIPYTWQCEKLVVKTGTDVLPIPCRAFTMRISSGAQSNPHTRRYPGRKGECGQVTVARRFTI